MLCIVFLLDEAFYFFVNQGGEGEGGGGEGEGERGRGGRGGGSL